MYKRQHYDEAVRISRGRIDSGNPKLPLRASELAWLALVYETRFEAIGRNANDTSDLAAAAVALEQGTKLDPYGIEQPRRLMQLYARLGQPETARMWAKKVLELDKLKRLDREVQGLSEEDRIEAERLSANP